MVGPPMHKSSDIMYIENMVILNQSSSYTKSATAPCRKATDTNGISLCHIFLWIKIFGNHAINWNISRGRIASYPVGRQDLMRKLITSSSSASKDYNTNLYKGFHGFDKKWDGNALKKQASVTYTKDSTILRQFQEFLTECRQEDIPVVLIVSPFYIGGTEKMSDYAGMHNMFAEIAHKNGIPLLDYTYDELSYDTTYFYNTMHLNKTGANLFSEKVAHAIDSLGVLKMD